MNETPQEYTKRILSYQEGQDPLKIQRATAGKISRLIKGVSKKKLMTRPEPTKWSVAEIIAHLADTELVGGFRMRLILGQNGVAIQAFDQDVWAEQFEYQKRDPAKSLAAFRALRENNIALVESLPKPMWERYGIHSERGKESVSRVVQMFAGHDLNHLGQIQQILKHSQRAAGR